MHLLGCLDVPTAGTFRLVGEDLNAMTEVELAHVRNRRIGFVFQQFNLAPPFLQGPFTKFLMLGQEITRRGTDFLQLPGGW